MQYFELPHLKNPVSRFIFGTAIGAMFANGDAGELLDAVFAAGVNTFDTAVSYGESECSLGRWLKSRGLRERVNILTKGCNPNKYRPRVTPYDLRSDLADSLAKLDVDCVDIYLLHRDDPAVPVGPIVETLNELQAAGRLRCFGGSNWTHGRIEAANEYAYAHGLNGFSVSSPCFSLAEQIGDPWGGSVHISGPKNREAREWYKRTGMPVLAYSSLARGFLSGKFSPDSGQSLEEIFPRLGWAIAAEYEYPDNLERLRRAGRLAAEKGLTVPQVALAWILRHPLFVSPILSPSSIAHLEANLQAFAVELTEAEFLYLNLGEE